MTKSVRTAIDRHVDNALMPKTRLERLSSDFKFRIHTIQEKTDNDFSRWLLLTNNCFSYAINPLKYEKPYPLLHDVMFYSIKKGNEFYKYLKTRMDFYADKETKVSVKPKRRDLESPRPLTADEIVLIRRMDKLYREKKERVSKFNDGWFQLLITENPEDYKEKLKLFESFIMEKYNLTDEQLKRISVHAIFVGERITNYDLFMNEIENVSLM